jgi:hypothetical protein
LCGCEYYDLPPERPAPFDAVADDSSTFQDPLQIIFPESPQYRNRRIMFDHFRSGKYPGKPFYRVIREPMTVDIIDDNTHAYALLQPCKEAYQVFIGEVVKEQGPGDDIITGALELL